MVQPPSSRIYDNDYVIQMPRKRYLHKELQIQWGLTFQKSKLTPLLWREKSEKPRFSKQFDDRYEQLGINPKLKKSKIAQILIRRLQQSQCLKNTFLMNFINQIMVAGVKRDFIANRNTIKVLMETRSIQEVDFSVHSQTFDDEKSPTTIVWKPSQISKPSPRSSFMVKRTSKPSSNASHQDNFTRFASSNKFWMQRQSTIINVGYLEPIHTTKQLKSDVSLTSSSWSNNKDWKILVLKRMKKWFEKHIKDKIQRQWSISPIQEIGLETPNLFESMQLRQQLFKAISLGDKTTVSSSQTPDRRLDQEDKRWFQLCRWARQYSNQLCSVGGQLWYRQDAHHFRRKL